MQQSFHYYGTFCAAFLAGFSVRESQEICYSAQLADWCSRTFLQRIGAPLHAATTQLPAEMANARTDPVGLADITRIWASFHFLPYDLHASVPKGGRAYASKYRMICGPNGVLLRDTVELAQNKGAQAAGLAMHVLADTWAHRYFAGTPSLVINNTNRFFVELVPADEAWAQDAQKGKDGWESAQTGMSEAGPKAASGTPFVTRPVRFRHNPGADDDFVAGVYTNTIYQASENSVMNLGHGRVGHLPDYSFARYRYVPAWGNYEEIEKDNPTEYYQAFCQMVYALRWLREPAGDFATHTYDTRTVAPYEARIRRMLETRQPDAGACKDWCAFGRELTGCDLPDFDLNAYVRQYMEASDTQKDNTFLGRFVLAALAQKGMVVNRVYASGNPLAGRSVNYNVYGFAGIRDFLPLVRYLGRGRRKDHDE